MAHEGDLDVTQRRLLEEQCILVDTDDNVQGCATKRECHLKENIVEQGLLHRAFSVFLFNSKGDLLIQQRADTKITFPGLFTNSCCSHPLYVESEMEENECLGVKRAAKRRLEYELGIPQKEVTLDDFQFLTRIHYKASSDKIWGEHEIDYVLFIQKDVTLAPNLNEVQLCEYMSQGQVRRLLSDSNQDDKVKVTPWFKLIGKDHLFHWWNNLGNLKTLQDHSTIHRM
ncbi:predicted protein [Nematostella vectensis]|uniref:isopentenyl-diphosphate Delta-isomerase n=1 Tax=Nematostella vectensis TaxID=45351 RepID=A7SK28_NEMVE|nr:predicted protein [Nematostella vectensis]|eukprot:XP_001628003.1 predicted protein [Nematostella vectensis]